MPNQAHLHLLMNHFPVIGFTFALIVAIYACLRKSFEGARISWLISIIAGAMALPTYLTGSGAAKVLKKFPEVVRSTIGPHADMGTYGLYVALAAAALALVAMIISFYKEEQARKLMIPILLMQILSFLVLGYASHLGGEIRHPETEDEVTEQLNSAHEPVVAQPPSEAPSSPEPGASVTPQ